MLRRLVLSVATLAALGAAAPAGAQDPPPPPPPEPVIQDGVRVSGVNLSGMTASEATAALRAFFARPLQLGLGRTTIVLPPARLGARARIAPAVARALAAPAGTRLTLNVAIVHRNIRVWVKRRANAFNRGPISTRARLVDLRPRLTEARPGRTLLRKRAHERIAAVLRNHRRYLLMLPVRTTKPAVTPRSHGPVVVIRRGSKRLTLYRGTRAGPMNAVATFPIATGMAAYPTPVGNFRIVTKQRNPWWYPPSAGWASGASPIPPGPGNPLGTRWMGLNVGAVGIHGTPDAASIGYSASHGCIRMHISNSEWLFERVRVGTPVFIRSA